MPETFQPTDWTTHNHAEYVIHVLQTWEREGWKYEPLTNDTGLTYATLYAYRTGRRAPTVAAAIKMQRAIFDYGQQLLGLRDAMEEAIAAREQAEAARDKSMDAAIEARRIPSHVRDMIFQRYGGRCCHCQIERNLEIDHVIPVSRGGDGDPSNLQVLCAQCNRQKRARTMSEWYEWLSEKARAA